MIIVLCIVFLKFFGLSTLDKWERQDVQIVRRREGRKSLPAPAVTICAITKDLLGWRPEAPEGMGLDKCQGISESKELVYGSLFEHFRAFSKLIL